MCKQCICFSLSKNIKEKNYEYLTLLLLKSLELTNPNIDLYCGLFTDKLPDEKLLKLIKDKVNIIHDKKFKVNGNRNYFLRLYTMYYFTHVYNLLEKYDQVIYVDIDVVFLKNFNYILPNKSILIETFPNYILKEVDKKYINKPYFFPWFQILTKDNKFIYDLNYNSDTLQDDYFNAIIESNLKQIPIEFGALYDYKPLRNDTLVFHHDGFIWMGYGFKLLDTNFKNDFKPIIDRYFDLNDIEYYYWEKRKHGIINEM